MLSRTLMRKKTAPAAGRLRGGAVKIAGCPATFCTPTFAPVGLGRDGHKPPKPRAYIGYFLPYHRPRPSPPASSPSGHGPTSFLGFRVAILGGHFPFRFRTCRPRSRRAPSFLVLRHPAPKAVPSSAARFVRAAHRGAGPGMPGREPLLLKAQNSKPVPDGLRRHFASTQPFPYSMNLGFPPFSSHGELSCNFNCYCRT